MTVESSTEDRKAKFGTITFNEPGTYVYEVTEKEGTVQGIVYDTTVYSVTFYVERDEKTGKLTAKENTSMTQTATVTNLYDEIPGVIEVERSIQ